MLFVICDVKEGTLPPPHFRFGFGHLGLGLWSKLRWPPPGGLPQRPKVLSSGGSGVSEQAFRLRSFVRASPGTGLRATAARFY